MSVPPPPAEPPDLPTLAEVLRLHLRLIEQSGGSPGVRDKGLLESALAQPAAAFGGADLYPTLEEKAAALCFGLVRNHPFVDGNKRIGHAAAVLFLKLNGREFAADVDDAERTILALADGSLSREELTAWVRAHAVPAGS